MRLVQSAGPFNFLNFKVNFLPNFFLARLSTASCAYVAACCQVCVFYESDTPRSTRVFRKGAILITFLYLNG